MSPRDYCLYHYTSYDTLRLILAQDGGFWPRYCPEDFSWVAGTPLYIVVPLVSFCDIPIILSKEHKEAYGNVAIGLSKEWGKEKNITPLLYVYEKGLLAQHIGKSIGRRMNKSTIDKLDFGLLWEFIHYLKPVNGHFFDKESHKTRNKDFDEEMEWRYVPEEFKTSIYPSTFFESSEKDDAERRSKDTFIAKLKFIHSDVEIVVVENNDQRKKLSEEFKYLRGKISLWSELEIVDTEQDA